MFPIDTKFLNKLRQANRRLFFLLLACVAPACPMESPRRRHRLPTPEPILSFSPGAVTALTSTDGTGTTSATYTGPLSGISVYEPQALTYDSNGDLFIVDAGNYVVRVVAGPIGKADPLAALRAKPGSGTVYTVAGSGSNTPSVSQLCSTDERSSNDNNFYGNGCPATKAILYRLQRQHSTAPTSLVSSLRPL